MGCSGATSHPHYGFTANRITRTSTLKGNANNYLQMEVELRVSGTTKTPADFLKPICETVVDVAKVQQSDVNSNTLKFMPQRMLGTLVEDKWRVVLLVIRTVRSLSAASGETMMIQSLSFDGTYV
ncbi:hypothetical protein YC2023_091903 [Brassica napus]